MTDFFELVRAGVIGDGIAESGEHGGGDAGTPANPATVRTWAFVAVLEALDGGVPGFPGGGEAGDEDHGFAVAGDFDAEGVLRGEGRRRGVRGWMSGPGVVAVGRRAS